MFCRFLEFCLVSVNIPDCAIGIIATNLRGVKSDQREWGTWICVRDRRTSYSEGTAAGASRGYPAQESPEVAALPDRPGGIGGSHAAGHDTGRCGTDAINGSPLSPIHLTSLIDATAAIPRRWQCEQSDGGSRPL